MADAQPDGLSAPRRALPGRRPRPRAACGGGEDGEEASRLGQLKVRRLEEEIRSLQDMYSRKIANTELKCEELLSVKEEERNVWYKEQKRYNAQLRSTVAIMHSIWQVRFRKRAQQTELEKEDFQKQTTEQFQAQVARLCEEHTAALEQSAAELAERSREYEAMISELSDEKAQAEAAGQELRGLLSQAQAQAQRSGEELAAQRAEIAELKRRLTKAERSEELERATAHIEEIEGELRRTKRIVQEQKHAEADSLRKELQEYVKFIQNLLPDDLRAQVLGRSDLPPPSELQGRMPLPAPALPGPTAVAAVAPLPARARALEPLPQQQGLPGRLPPMNSSAVAASTGGDWRHRPRCHPTVSPRVKRADVGAICWDSSR
mmetsp:Transcript_63497/g.136521  ORF Transcript_63497/g.136521 Transcript_63497/m.136521 type:complete len:377 (+) Transcript_63497:83-1213(+)